MIITEESQQNTRWRHKIKGKFINLNFKYIELISPVFRCLSLFVDSKTFVRCFLNCRVAFSGFIPSSSDIT